MLNQTTQPGRRTRLWFLSLACLIDGFLDRVEKLSSSVLPAKAANPSYGTEIEARLERFGA